MSEEANAPTASDYIVHHLTHWQNKPQTEVVDFSVFNIDSLFFSILLGVVGVCMLLHGSSGKRRRRVGKVDVVDDADNGKIDR